MFELIIPFLIFMAVSVCLVRKVEVYNTFLSGVENGLKTLVRILPAMVAVMSAAAMLRESGIMTYLAQILERILPFDIPEEIITVSILRPVSGGGSIGLLAEILNTHGADSEIGRIASVIAASSETTLYVLMVYFGVTRVKYTGRVLASALFGDFICVLTALWVCKMIF